MIIYYCFNCGECFNGTANMRECPLCGLHAFRKDAVNKDI